MNTPKAILSLADARTVEAEGLHATGHYDLAFYVSGYVVELYLKAKICQLLDIPDYFDFGNQKNLKMRIILLNHTKFITLPSY